MGRRRVTTLINLYKCPIYNAIGTPTGKIEIIFIINLLPQKILRSKYL